VNGIQLNNIIIAKTILEESLKLKNIQEKQTELFYNNLDKILNGENDKQIVAKT